MHGYMTDRQGNVRAVRRSDGTVVQTADYYPYGVPSAVSNPTANAYMYGGKRLDTRNGLNMSWHGARLLLNDLGRFASPDPLAELTPGASAYAYCAGDPVNFTDPTGEIPTPVEAAYMAAYSYGDQSITTLTGNWESVGSYTSFLSASYQGSLFRRMTDNGYEYAFAFAGTFFEGSNRGVSSIIRNVTQLLGLSIDVYLSINDAINIVKQYSDSEITFIGHSKGGAQAIACAIKTNRSAITFNPAGLSRLTLGINPKRYNDTQGFGIINYIMENDPVDWLNRLLDMMPEGSIIAIDSTSESWIDNHIIDNIIKSLRSN